MHSGGGETELRDRKWRERKGGTKRDWQGERGQRESERETGRDRDRDQLYSHYKDSGGRNSFILFLVYKFRLNNAKLEIRDRHFVMRRQEVDLSSRQVTLSDKLLRR